jgi:hypothetical protein
VTSAQATDAGLLVVALAPTADGRIASPSSSLAVRVGSSRVSRRSWAGVEVVRYLSPDRKIETQGGCSVSDNPLQRAEVHVIVSARAPSPVEVTGLPGGPSVDLKPGETMILPRAEPQTTPERIFQPPVTVRPIFRPPVTPRPIKMLLEHEHSIRLTDAELAEMDPDAPIVIGTRSRVVALAAFEEIAEQAVEGDRVLIIRSLFGDDE